MQKWGKRPIYFKNAEIMQNALIMQTLRPLQYDLVISSRKLHENVITFYGGKIQKIPFSIIFLLKTAILHE